MIFRYAIVLIIIIITLIKIYKFLSLPIKDSDYKGNFYPFNKSINFIFKIFKNQSNLLINYFIDNGNVILIIIFRLVPENV